MTLIKNKKASQIRKATY